MLVSIMSIFEDPCEMSWAKAALALAPLCGDLKAEDFFWPYLQMWVFKILNLS